MYVVNKYWLICSFEHLFAVGCISIESMASVAYNKYTMAQNVVFVQLVKSDLCKTSNLQIKNKICP